MDEQHLDVNAEAEQVEEAEKPLSVRLAELSEQLPGLALLAAGFLSSVVDPSTVGGPRHRG